ncbi:MAG: ABC transporter permease, partial [Pirellulaceae bacterium]
FSILMMPLLMFGSIFAMDALSNTGEIKDLTIVVIDHTNKLFAPLKLQAETHTQQITHKLGISDDSTGTDDAPGTEASKLAAQTQTSEEDENGLDSFGSISKGQRYHLELWKGDDITNEDRYALSEQVRQQELYAFLEIPADLLDLELFRQSPSLDSLPVAQFYSEDSNFSDARSWMSASLSELVKAYRLAGSGIDVETVNKLIVPTRVQGLGLLDKSATGDIEEGEEKDDLQAILLPLGVMMLMFMVIFMASQPMLESVLEEKSQRIAEVLLGSANPYQLMTGKLFGTVGGSLTILLIYLAGGYALAAYRGWTEYIPVSLIPWFVVFQILGVLFFASIFMAVGASVTQLKEAQSLLLPVWMLLMSPLFVWMLVIREPNGAMATWFSYFPPATPTMMVLRLSTSATIPAWQPWVCLVILVVATVLCVYIAARIFRVGLLWQGKTPKLNELFHWAFRG